MIQRWTMIVAIACFLAASLPLHAADGSYGDQAIYIDLTIAGARVISPGTVHIAAIKINGTTSGVGPGNIILRRTSAAGPIIWQELGPSATSFDGTDARPFSINGDGLYMDALTNAWAAGSTMIIYLK
jgi:hypothetical protein